MDNDKAYVKLWHASGVQVTIPVSAETALTVDQAALLHANVTTLLAAGWLVSAPGMEVGEQESPIDCVVRRMQNKDGKTTNILDIYIVGKKKRWVRKYLNNDTEIEKFENVSGLKVNDLPLYNSRSPIEMDKDPEIGVQYGRALPKRPSLIWKDNPAYDPDARNSNTPKYEFVRWKANPTYAPTPASTPQTVHTQTVPPLTVVERPESRQETVNAPAPSAITVDQWKPILAHYNAKGMSNNDILDVLGVTRLSEWRGTLTEAQTTIENELQTRIGNPVFALIVHKATKKTVQTTPKKRGGVCVSFEGVMRYSPETPRKIDVWDWDGNLDALREAGLNMNWLTQPGTQVFSPPLTVNATLGDDGYFKIVSCDDASGVTVNQDTFDDLLPA